MIKQCSHGTHGDRLKYVGEEKNVIDKVKIAELTLYTDSPAALRPWLHVK